jgi:serine/threonine protein kinase
MSQLIANRYEILSEFGQGGMGTVYRVRDTLADGQEMALKTIRTDGALTSELQLRFKAEFRSGKNASRNYRPPQRVANQ